MVKAGRGLGTAPAARAWGPFVQPLLAPEECDLAAAVENYRRV